MPTNTAAGGMNNVSIAKPPKPEVTPRPQLETYKTPEDAQVTTPKADTTHFSYKPPSGGGGYQNQAPTQQGLLEFNPTKSGQMDFNSQGVNTDNLAVKTAEVPKYQAGQEFISPESMVENRVQGLVDPNSQLNRMLLAQNKAKMNARGIAGSSIDDSSGQTAVLQNAVQIASQDAQTHATADLNRQSATYGSQRANQDVTNQGNLATHNTNLQGALKDQADRADWNKTKLQGAITGDLKTQDANIANAARDQQGAIDWNARQQQGLLEGAKQEQAGNIQAEMAKFENVAQQNMTLLDHKLKSSTQNTSEQNAMIMEQYKAQQAMVHDQMKLEYDRVAKEAALNSEQRQSLANEMSEMAHNYEISIQNILVDPNLNAEAKNTAIARMNEIFNADMANIARIFGAEYQSTGTGA